MSKFLALVAICLAGVVQIAGAEPVEVRDEEPSSWALDPTDQEETANLPPDQKAYSDFCIQSRDLIKADMRQSIGDGFNTLKSLLNPFTAAQTFSQQLEQVKKPGGPACERIWRLRKQVSEKFDDYKEQLSKEASGGRDTTFNWVKCVSTQRLIFLADRCTLLADEPVI